MIKFAHISDTHLGYRQYKIEEREKDIENIFSKIIDNILKDKNIKFVVHSGDFFETGSPKISTLVFAIEMLKKLKEKNVKVFAIPGNHDYKVDENVITLLEKIGLLVNLASKERYRKLPNGFLNLGYLYELDGLKIYLAGLPGIRSRIEELYLNQKFNINNSLYDFSIFLFHHTLKEVDSKEGDIPYSLLPKGFNYYAGGHWHIKTVLRSKRVFYPGSIDVHDLKEVESLAGKENIFILKNKYFFVYNIDNNKLEEVSINIRPFVYIRFFSRNLKPKDIENELLKWIKTIEPTGNPILYVKVFGKVEGSKLEINKLLLEEIAKNRGFLTLRLNLDYLESREDVKIRNIKEKSVEEVEREYLKELGFSDKEIDILHNILNILGRDFSNDIEKRAAIHKSIKLIKDLFEINDI